MGLGIPDEPGTRYFDISYVDKSTGVPPGKRGSQVYLWNTMSSDTRAWTIDNFKIYSIGGV
ncbi:hypothetical protein [Sinomonas gamaensis]|uniref:hypothetical protein n=1 Tax=Sinomonas gamaensis TaxID=2565624 RepID=UPI001107CD12|nr:hypothetical protein [Sinomonas gamaensis]